MAYFWLMDHIFGYDYRNDIEGMSICGNSCMEYGI